MRLQSLLPFYSMVDVYGLIVWESSVTTADADADADASIVIAGEPCM